MTRFGFIGQEVVDTETGLTVATVSPPPVAGEIIGVQFWNPSTLLWVAIAPNVIIGETIGINVLFKNTTNWIKDMYVVMTVTKPDITTSVTTGPILSTNPGMTGETGWKFQASQIGVYTVNIKLFAKWVG